MSEAEVRTMMAAQASGGDDYQSQTGRAVDGRPAPKVIGDGKPAGERTREVVIHGHAYTFALPKAHQLMQVVVEARRRRDGDDSGVAEIAAYQQMVDMILGYLPDEQADDLRARLDDPHGPVDADDIIETFRYLQAEAAGRPTSEQSD